MGLGLLKCLQREYIVWNEGELDDDMCLGCYFSYSTYSCIDMLMKREMCVLFLASIKHIHCHH